jgi:hypothetical protein
VLKPSVALASLTYDWNTNKSAWGNANNLANKYDLTVGLFPWGSSAGGVCFGNGNEQVFSGAVSGTLYLRTACGIQSSTQGASSSGTNLFGSDFCEQNNRANLFPSASGHWNDSPYAGVFYRYWGYYRSLSSAYYGFRAAAYG